MSKCEITGYSQDYGNVRGEGRTWIVRRCQTHGIEVPFPAQQCPIGALEDRVEALENALKNGVQSTQLIKEPGKPA